jgi:uncharacterized protein (TIGR02996 family)
MDTHAALIGAIVENPDDDAPRLVYSDWLEESGQPERAKFVRLQVAAARLPEGAERSRLEHHADRLRDEYLWRWEGELPELPGVAWGGYERGFVASVTVDSWRTLVRHIDRIWRHTPVAGLRIRQLDAKDVARLAGWPHLARFHSLDLSAQLGPEGVVTLCRSAGLAGLQSLELAHCRIGRSGVEALARCRHLAGLRYLGLSCTEIGGTALRALFASAYLCGLESLALAEEGWYIWRPGWPNVPMSRGRALDHLAGLPNLKRLDLTGNYLRADSIPFLCTALRDLRVERLNLSKNLLEDAGVQELADCSGLEWVRELDLSGCWFGAMGALALSRSSHLDRLEVLTVRDSASWILRGRFGDRLRT